MILGLVTNLCLTIKDKLTQHIVPKDMEIPIHVDFLALAVAIELCKFKKHLNYVVIKELCVATIDINIGIYISSW